MGKVWIFYHWSGVASLVLWAVVLAAVVLVAVKQRRVLPLLTALLIGVLGAFGMTRLLAGAMQEGVWAWVSVWVVAGAVLGVVVWSTRRSVMMGLAGAVVLAALLGAAYASMAMEVPIDRTKLVAAIEAQAEAERAARFEQRRREAADVQFAEDSEQDRLDRAGLTKDQQADLEGERPAAGPEYVTIDRSYRLAGPQVRESGKTQKLEEFEGIVPAEEVTFALEPGEHGTMVRRAGWNLYGAMAAGLALLAMAGWDYLLRFNQTMPRLRLVPLAGRTLDSGFGESKRHVVALSGGDEALERFVSKAKAKGEPVVVFAQKGMGGAGRRHVVVGPAFHGGDVELLLEMLWLGKRSCTVLGVGNAKRLIRELEQYLLSRAATGAKAWRSVNIVWGHEWAMPGPLFESLCRLVRETNCRLVVAGDGGGEEVEEVVGAEAVGR